MALTTRVWSAGKLLLLAGALFLTYVIFAAVGMRVALKTREVQVPALGGKTVNEATAVLTEAGLQLKVEEGRRLDPKVPAGQIVAQEPAAGVSTRRERSVKVWVSGGPRSLVVPALNGESERTAQLRLQQEGLEVGAGAEIRSADYPAGTVVAQFPAPKTAGAQVALLVNRGERGARYVMPDLIGVNGERAAEAAAHPRLPGHGGRRSPLPWRLRGHRPAAESAGGLPDRPGRADLSRGQPLDGRADRAVAAVRGFRGAREGHRRRRARRRRPAARRRDGRPLRAQPVDWPAGRPRHSPGRDHPAGRAPDARQPGRLPDGVHRRGSVADHGARRGAASPASDAAGPAERRRQGRGGDQSVDAGGRARGNRRRRRSGAAHVRQPGLWRPDFHPAQRV